MFILTYRAIIFIQWGLIQYVSEKRNKEGQGFSTSCLGNADQVTSGHDGWNSLTLDWGGFLKIVSVKSGGANIINSVHVQCIVATISLGIAVHVHVLERNVKQFTMMY